MKVIKRDGHTVTYDRSKIITAIKKANAEVEPGEKVTDEKIEEIVQGIERQEPPTYAGGGYPGYHRAEADGGRQVCTCQDLHYLSLYP